MDTALSKTVVLRAFFMVHYEDGGRRVIYCKELPKDEEVMRLPLGMNDSYTALYTLYKVDKRNYIAERWC